MKDEKDVRPAYQAKGLSNSHPILHVFLSWLSVIGCLATSLFLIVFLFAYSLWKDVWMFVLLYIPSILFLLWISFSAASMFWARYEFQEQGLWVKYVMLKPRIIDWAEFQQICICRTSSGGRLGGDIICFVRKGEKPDSYGRWKTKSFFHYRRVIAIDYTPELCEGVKERCPYEVVDLRNSLTYRF